MTPSVREGGGWIFSGITHSCYSLSEEQNGNLFSLHSVIMVSTFRLRPSVPVCITHNLHYM